MIEFRVDNFAVPNAFKDIDWQAHWAQLAKRDGAGFLNIPDDDRSWQAVKERISELETVTHVLLIAIGGSSLGMQVIQRALGSKRKIMVLEAPDPQTLQLAERFCEDGRHGLHVVVTSKSGGTLEPLAWVEILAQKNWLKPKSTTVIASPGEKSLQQWAKQQKVHTLWIPASVGGRFSVLTAAGMLPAGLMGLDIDEFRAGARWALNEKSLSEKMALSVLNSWKQDFWVSQLWTFSDNLSGFGAWWQQLWSESLAKKMNRQGKAGPRVSTPMACRGPRDQHSMAQQLIEGANDKFVFLTRVASLEEMGEEFTGALFRDLPFFGHKVSLGRVLGAEAQAFAQSLEESSVPFATLTLSELNERSLGALFMLWQMTVALLAEQLNIDGFNQPGVELGKKIAAKILKK